VAVALSYSLARLGKVDISSKSTKEVINELTQVENPLVFFDPTKNNYVAADEYLSGDVKTKLKEAQENNLANNIKALE